MSINYTLGFDMDTPVGQHFTLSDIVATDYNVANNPTQEHFDNITGPLADLLDNLWDQIGPFSILSGYRSAELQQLLRDDTDAAAAGLSYHELGIAVDIAPLSQDLSTFFGLILGQPDLLNECGECAIKPTQNSLHISTATNAKTGVAMIMGADDVYRRLSPEQILQYIKYPVSILPIALAVTGVLAFWFLKIRPGLLAKKSPA